MRFAEVTLSAPADLRDFYGGELGLLVDREAIVVGETKLRFEVELRSDAFYHFAFLVPGDRFDAALVWTHERVEVLGDVFVSESWDSRAVYFHDPAGNIVELIAHHGLEENGRSGPFVAEELSGFSELGIVGDTPHLLQQLETAGLRLWSGTVAEPHQLAFVGEKGRTLIIAPPGRGWLPTDRPAEPHPVEARLAEQVARCDLVTVCYLADREPADGRRPPPPAASNRLLLG